MSTKSSSTMVQLYINQLSDMEKKVLKIAQEHLETSFCLEKSIGFKIWQSKQPVPQLKTEETFIIIRKKK